jgi:hypothetical protein
MERGDRCRAKSRRDYHPFMKKGWFFLVGHQQNKTIFCLRWATERIWAVHKYSVCRALTKLVIRINLSRLCTASKGHGTQCHQNTQKLHSIRDTPHHTTAKKQRIHTNRKESGVDVTPQKIAIRPSPLNEQFDSQTWKLYTSTAIISTKHLVIKLITIMLTVI